MIGRLICLEGGEGAGKSTAIPVIQEWLEARGRSVRLTREPGGTRLAERIRDVLLDRGSGEMDPMTELLLMFAARRENVVGVIGPALANGTDVVCDRFTDASYAYQGAGRELGAEAVDVLAEQVHPDLTPSLVLVLDVPVEVGLARARGRAGDPDRFEVSDRAFFERVRQAYLERACLDPDRYVVIDASRAQDAVAAAVRAALEERLT